MKYEYKKGKFIKNGHTMFEEDVLRDLERLAYLEGDHRLKCSVVVKATGENCPEKPIKEFNGKPVCDKCYHNWIAIKKYKKKIKKNKIIKSENGHNIYVNGSWVMWVIGSKSNAQRELKKYLEEQ